MSNHYTTTLNSGLKFIDHYVNTDTNWVVCNNNENVYTEGEYTLTTKNVSNVNVFSLMKNSSSIQINELPINLRVNMVLDEDNNRTFRLEKKDLSENITKANATLGFDPKYFIYDSSNNCYTIDSEAIILDHDVSACTGITAVKVFEVDESGKLDTTKPSDYIKAEIDTTNRQLNIGVSNITTSIIDNAITNITTSNDYITIEKTDSHTFNISFDNTKVHTYTATSGYYINVSAETEGINDNFTISLNANVNSGSTYIVGENNLDTLIAVSAKSNEVALPNTINISDSSTKLVNNNGDIDVYVGAGKKINFYVNGEIVLTIGENQGENQD